MVFRSAFVPSLQANGTGKTGSLEASLTPSGAMEAPRTAASDQPWGDNQDHWAASWRNSVAIPVGTEFRHAGGTAVLHMTAGHFRLIDAMTDRPVGPSSLSKLQIASLIAQGAIGPIGTTSMGPTRADPSSPMPGGAPGTAMARRQERSERSS